MIISIFFDFSPSLFFAAEDADFLFSCCFALAAACHFLF